MDTDGNGTIDKYEFLAVNSINKNPLAMRLIALFDNDGSESVDFTEFINGLNAFSGKGLLEDKLKCKIFLKL